MIHGRIYKIYSNVTGECYYGSTEQTLSRRLSKHKSDNKRWKKGLYKSYDTSFRIIERGNFTISLLEENDFENRDFMIARERYYIENFECVNKRIEGRTQKEYREANKEQLSSKHKEYYQKKKEQIKVNVKKYRESNKEKISQKKCEKITCECGCILSRVNLSTHRKSPKHLKKMENKKN